MPRFVTKIVGGKLVTVPVFSHQLPMSQQSGISGGTYPWGRRDPVPTHKIGSRTYPVLPPISIEKKLSGDVKQIYSVVGTDCSVS